MTANRPAISLALSGGGVRAMVFHCGVLRWLANSGRLEDVSQISSVSGGTLLVGMVLSKNSWRWPSSRTFLDSVLPQVKQTLTTTDLQSKAWKRLIRPSSWPYLLSRANVLSRTIEECWGITASISDIPENPCWTANGTTAENGKRFRFKRTSCGDYEVGYANASEFGLADVMAISAAFPVAIGPFAIRTQALVWHKRETWDSSHDQEANCSPPYEVLHLYDGGIYDNLGLEPLFDVGTQEPKGASDYIIVSDAGAPLQRTSPGFALSPFRIKRVADIMQDQIRALRVRAFVNYIKENPLAGAYLQIGAGARDRIERYRNYNEPTALRLLQQDWLTDEQASDAARYPTSLHSVSSSLFEEIERHGFETALWNEALFGSAVISCG